MLMITNKNRFRIRAVRVVVEGLACFPALIMRKSSALNTQSCGLSHYQSRKMRQPLDYYTGDSSSNGDDQWEHTREMACTAPTATPARRRMIRSTVTRPAMSLASRQNGKSLEH